MQPPLCSYTYLAFLINWIIDRRPPSDLTFDKIHAAAQHGQFIELLRTRYGHIADFSLMRTDWFLNLEQMEAALSEAASVLYHAESKAGVQHSGLCLALAIVLEAIQQQFHMPPPPSADHDTHFDLPAPWTDE